MNIESILEKIVEKKLFGMDEKKIEAKNPTCGKTYIIRAKSAGVFVGTLIKIINCGETDTVTLDDCRRIWYWDGASSISQIAINGVSKPSNCKFSVLTQGHEVLGVIEKIPMTETAKKSVYGVSEWKS